MTLQPFDGFDPYPTHHCVTGSLRHVYDYHGHSVSEDLLLGLGSGLGFAYFHFKGGDPFYGGRANHVGPGNEGLERTVGRRTGVAVETYTTTSGAKAQRALRELLERREPVLVYLDMGLLPYFDFPDDFHFGGHVVVVAGHDAETDQVLIADREVELHPVGWDVLERARGSTFKPFPPRYRWFTFDFTSGRPPTPTEVCDAIGDVCRGMLGAPIANLGVKGIRTAALRTRRWPLELDDEALRRVCATAAVFIDNRGGTGGGIFRSMYSRFLVEAAAITGQDRFAELSPRLGAIGDRWEEVAAALASAAEAADPPADLEVACAVMLDLAQSEQGFWEDLAASVEHRTPAPVRQ